MVVLGGGTEVSAVREEGKHRLRSCRTLLALLLLRPEDKDNSIRVYRCCLFRRRASSVSVLVLVGNSRRRRRIEYEEPFSLFWEG